MSEVSTRDDSKELIVHIVPILHKWCKDYRWKEEEIESLINSLGDILSIDYTGNSGAFDQILLPPGADCKFPTDFYSITKASIIPREGSPPTEVLEGDEIFVPTYKLANAISLHCDYLRDKRKDIIRRSIAVFLKCFQNRIEFDKYRLLLETAKKKIKKPRRNLKALVEDFASRGKKLTHMVVSAKAMELMKKESNAGSLVTYPKLSEITDSTIPVMSGLNALYGIEIIVIPNISDIYYSLNSNGQKWYYRLGRWLLNKIGLSQIERDIMLGLDLTNKSVFFQPIRERLNVFDDPTLARSCRVGIYGWMEHGIAILDPEPLGIAYFPFSR